MSYFRLRMILLDSLTLLCQRWHTDDRKPQEGQGHHSALFVPKVDFLCLWLNSVSLGIWIVVKIISHHTHIMTLFSATSHRPTDLWGLTKARNVPRKSRSFIKFSVWGPFNYWEDLNVSKIKVGWKCTLSSFKFIHLMCQMGTFICWVDQEMPKIKVRCGSPCVKKIFSPVNSPP